MDVLNIVKDRDNSFLSRRELTCNFLGLGGKLQKSQAIEMISAKLGLDKKTIIPIKLQHQVGRSTVTGTFYIYQDQNLAKKHVNPTIFARLERIKGESE